MSERRVRGRGGPARKPRARGGGSRPPPKRVTHVTFDSSSSDGSDVSDIPLIALQKYDSDEAEGTHLLDIGGDERIEVVENVDWTSKPTASTRKPRDPVRAQAPRKKTSPVKPPPPKIIKPPEPEYSEPEEPEEPEPPVEKPAPVVAKVITPPPVQEIVQPQPQQVIPRAPETSEFTTYQIIRDQKHKKFGTTELTMTKDSTVIFVAQFAHDKLNSMYIISTERRDVTAVTGNPAVFKGYIRVHDMNKRFTICSAGDRRKLDDRDPEIAGVAVSKQSFRKSKTCRIAVPSDLSVHYPISKRKNLSRMAAKGSDPDHQADRFNFWETKSADDSSLSQVHSRSSSKNCAIYDKSNQMIFRFFRSHENLFTVSMAHPISPFIGFGIAIALIHSPTS